MSQRPGSQSKVYATCPTPRTVRQSRNLRPFAQLSNVPSR
ncbi:hypothetical protein DU502_11655 [Haloplanus aerogenes]|uniref:Zinc finger GAGA-binding factor domain-containing protein n=1 Tax=Haloplanus aerogenes TaxID=660522 RepID=A0A3G8R0A3_9EURY|nr:hypothetical protein DU502_11655 [Haloplanus aerogenes]